MDGCDNHLSLYIYGSVSGYRCTYGYLELRQRRRFAFLDLWVMASGIFSSDDLNRERLYVQLYSEKAPEGNLWGWLLAQENRR